MSLRYREDPEERLRPEEARAFLQVHAEREAGGPDGSRIEDLAESLGIPLEEARGILHEARRRASTAAPLKRRRERRGPALLLAGSGALALCALIALRSTATPPLVVSPAVAAPAAPKSVAAPKVFGNPLADFEFEIFTDNGAEVTERGALPGDSTSLRDLTPTQAETLRRDLTDTMLDTMTNMLNPDPNWDSARRITINLCLPTGRWMSLKVPVDPATFPLERNPAQRERLQNSIVRTLDAAWPQIVADGSL